MDGYAIYEKIKYKFKLSVFKMILEAQQKYSLLKTKIYYINHQEKEKQGIGENENEGLLLRMY